VPFRRRRTRFAAFSCFRRNALILALAVAFTASVGRGIFCIVFFIFSLLF
jgi:hypothetical protein